MVLFGIGFWLFRRKANDRTQEPMPDAGLHDSTGSHELEGQTRHEMPAEEKPLETEGSPVLETEGSPVVDQGWGRIKSSGDVNEPVELPARSESQGREK